MNNQADKDYWATSATDIAMDKIDSQLYKADSVIEFLKNKCFIIAEKGIGKTLLLKKKKHDLLQKDGVFFIPKNLESDIPKDFTTLSNNTINFLEKEKYTKLIWSLAIQLSVIKIFYNEEAIMPVHDKIKLPSLYNEIFTKERSFSVPSEIFQLLIKEIPMILQYNNNKNFYSIIDTSYKSIKVPIYIFIDRLDQAMLIEKTDVTHKMWVAMQTGLLESAWNLNEINSHIKIFCSIRKEAYDEYRSPVKSNLSGQVCFLHYRKDELHKLLNKLVEFYEGKGKTIENIVGLGKDGKFIHYKTGNEENVFSYILRHTLGKPRDLIRIAHALKMKIYPNTDYENIIKELRIVTNEAAKEIVFDTFAEKERFLDCLQNESERNKFLSLIPKNTLYQETVKKICKIFNEREYECTHEQCLKKEDTCKHPFCELFNIGLLGYVNPDENIQIFKDPDADTVKHITGNFNYYIIHPSLCEIIKKERIDLKGEKYTVTPGITTGNGYKWNKRESEISELIDFVLNSNLQEENERKIMQSLIDTIKDTKEISQLDKEIRKKIRSIQKKIFLSYCWVDEEEVNKIDNNIKALGLHITRDRRDLKYKMNIKEYMKSLRIHDYVIPVISASYLKSFNCMVEIGELLKMRNYQTKTLQIILPSADVFNNKKKYKYINYWQKEKEKMEKILKDNFNSQNISLIEDDINLYNDIIHNLPNFLEFIKGERGMLLTDLEKTGYQDLLNHINKKRGEIDRRVHKGVRSHHGVSKGNA